RMELLGHRWMVHDVRFHPSGDYLVSHSLREGQSRLWDLRTQRCILSTPGNSLGFSRDGQQLAVRHVDSLATLRLEGDREYQMLASNSGAEPDTWRAIFHPREPVVIEAGRDGIRCWHLATRRLIGSTPPEVVFTICFEPGTEDLVTAGSAGIRRRKLKIAPDGGSARFEEAEPLQFPGTGIDASRPAQALQLTPDGRQAIFRFSDEPLFHHVSWQTGRARRISCDPQARFWAISPDGRWAVSGNYQTPGYSVWNLRDETPSGVPIETPVVSAGQVTFSPDGTCLLACANDRFLIYQSETWKLLEEIPRQSTVEGACAFSDDGRFLAVTANTREVELRDAATRRLLARFDSDVDTINVLNMQFAPGNSENLCLACGPSGVRLWDLKAVHQVLRDMKLGW
ncbi:MAG: WD40 repeat domain-containing protein, partial [Planctomycetaceae bacterium]